MVIFGSGAESRPAWTRMVAVVYGSEGGELGFPSAVGSSMTSIATIEAAFQFLDLPMPCPDISIKLENESPFWIFVLGIKITE